MSSGTRNRLPRSRSSSIAAAVGAAGDGVAQRPGEPVEDGGAEQEVADLARLPGQHLVGQVVDDEPVAAGERLDEAGDLGRARDAAQREGGELQAGDPALGALLERLDVGGGRAPAPSPG